MAHRYWPGEQPVGKSLIIMRRDVNGAQKPRRVIGVVADVRDRINEEPEPTLYVPYTQVAFPSLTLVVHTHDSVAAVSKSVAAVVQTVDPDQPLRGVGPRDGALAESLEPWNAALILLGGLGVFRPFRHLQSPITLRSLIKGRSTSPSNTVQTIGLGRPITPANVNLEMNNLRVRISQLETELNQFGNDATSRRLLKLAMDD